MFCDKSLLSTQADNVIATIKVANILFNINVEFEFMQI